VTLELSYLQLQDIDVGFDELEFDDDDFEVEMEFTRNGSMRVNDAEQAPIIDHSR